MNSHPTPQQLAAFAGGNLTGAELGAVQSHLDSCDACCQALNKASGGKLVRLLRKPSEPRQLTQNPAATLSMAPDGVRRFHSAWQNGQTPRLDDYLPDPAAGQGARLKDLRELIKIDLQFRWSPSGASKRAPRFVLEDYLRQHPELKQHGKFPLDLIAEEYRVRRSAGDKTEHGEYLARFPEHAGYLAASLSRIDAELAARSQQSSYDSRNAETLPPPSPSPVIAARAALSLPPIAGYEILGVLGRGGMGIVYKARHLALKRIVALKMIVGGDHAGLDQLARFQTEAEAVARLKHPSIVQIYDIGRHDGLPYFALEFVEGGGLDRKLAGTPQAALAAAETVRILAEAMQAAHDAGIIHRDLKPANVLLTAEGKPKITDFGLAKQVDADVGHTQTGAIMGTPSYMAPEQASGNSKDIGPATDVYALGAILYEMLTGRPPFKAATAMETVLQVVMEEPVSPKQLQPNVPRDLETICLKCLQKAPKRRYENAQALAEDLRRFDVGEPILARPVGSLERAWRWCARNLAVAALMLAVALTLLLGTGVAWVLAVQARWSEQEAITERNEKVRALVQAVESDIKSRKSAEAEKLARIAAVENGKKALAAAEAEKNAHQAAEKRLRQIEKANDILGSIFRDLDPHWENRRGPDLRVQLGKQLDKAAAQLDGESIGDPVVVARVQVQLAESLLNLGYHQRAIGLYTKATQTLRTHAGIDNDDALHAINGLAVAHWTAEDVNKALPLFELSLEKSKSRFGAADRRTLTGANNLAEAYRKVGRLEEALTLLEQTLEMQKAKFGFSDSDSLTTMNNLAGIYQDLRHLGKATELFEKTLKMRKATLGVDHIDTVHTMGNLAAAYRLAGHLEKALPLLEQTLEKQRATLGSDHPANLAIMEKLVSCYQASGQLVKGIALLEHILAKDRASLGPDHPSPLKTMNNLAVAYQMAGQHAKAVVLYEQALGKLTEKLGRHHIDTQTCMHNLTWGYLELRLLAKAEPLCIELSSAKKQPASQARLIRALEELARLYEATGQKDRASHWRKKVEESRSSPNQGSTDHHQAVLRKYGTIDAAIEQYRKAIQLDPNNAKAHVNLGAALSFKNDLNGAIACYTKAVQLDPNLPGAQNNLGLVLMLNGQFSEARATLIRYLKLLASNDPAQSKGQQLLRECERLLALDQKCTAVLQGKAQPKDFAEQIGLADFCREYKEL